MKNFNNIPIRKSFIFFLLSTTILFSTAVKGYAQNTTHESEGVISTPNHEILTGLTPAEEIPPAASEGVFTGNLPNATQQILYQCLASDPNCLISYAINSNANTAQARALSLCIAASPFNFCYARGCIRLP